MFYKLENGKWLSGSTVHLPDGTILSKDNKVDRDGWFWMDSPPEGFENSEFSVN